MLLCSSFHSHVLHSGLLLLLLLLLPILPAAIVLPNPDPAEPLQQTFLPSPPSTIPSSPEQSALFGCPFSLPAALFPAVHSSCVATPLRRTSCCPVLATWLLSAYAATALAPSSGGEPPSYDMPVLPDDSEACVDSLEGAMRERGMDLPRPNSTCDVAYCYCGIRLLRQMSCPGAFHVDHQGVLFGGVPVSALERDCSNAGLAGCSACLTTLYKLNKVNSGNSTAISERTSKMRVKDCELMGLTWLLAKDRDTYMPTVTSILRVIMMSDGDPPMSCKLNRDGGMPLAVDSSDISGSSNPLIEKLGTSFLMLVVLCCLMNLMYLCFGEFLAVFRDE